MSNVLNGWCSCTKGKTKGRSSVGMETLIQLHANTTDALLADLQTTLHANGANLNDGEETWANESQAQHVTSQSYQYQHGDIDHQVTYANHAEVLASNNQNAAAAPQRNMRELDSLLDDLNRSRLSAGPSTGSVGHNSSGGNSNEGRPSVDALLNELSNAVHNSANYIRSDGSNKGSTGAASSATEELDVLMASLSTFKKGGAAGSPEPIETASFSKIGDATYAKPNKVHRANPKDQLDSMLGNLQADMNKQGISATTKGCCTACEKPIVGQVVTALGRTWHPEHFVCSHCRQELGTQNFFERDGQPYCEPDYHHLFSPRCAYCNGPILDKCVTALDQTWHPDHFFCTQCGCQFGEDGFQEKDGKPYCKEDYLAMFALKCKGCSTAITEGYISALNGQWHPNCFVCRDCNMLFQGGSFFVHEGMPYCEIHYHAKRGSLCAGCHKPITGRCITAMFKKFHPEHFVCSYCLKQLKKGTFKEQGDKPYCHGCFERLFG
ncbi:paxillin-like isoform X2 [Daphnia pulicaria]|uniref:paxillin-like isoform X2 n=1 Tax=Daphnia pulicaria TaxID=35523 RepID=UPI001EEC6EE5|nr:paxillin-like isoform X2 [Daphnia pulicaria]